MSTHPEEVASATYEDLDLAPQHVEFLKQRAVSAEVALERGYRSVGKSAELAALGFSEYQRRAPAFALPVWGVTGAIEGHQIKPDNPRKDKAGKLIKYETPRGAQLRIDVPPRVRPSLSDPEIPLWVTEGIPKGDAAAGQGLCCVDLAGVWAWRGTNGQGGRMALADWDEIALNGREVVVCFDSDAMTKRDVHAALVRLKRFLELRHARVRFAYLPAGQEGEKVGLDDYFAAGHTADDLRRLVEDELRALPDDQVDEPPEFPINALPGVVGRLVREGAAAVDVPPEFIGVPLLAFAGGTIGKRYCLELKSGHVEYPILYAAVIGAPGSGKSPAMGLARKALDRLQSEAWAAYQQEMGQYKRDKAEWDRKKPDERLGTEPKPPTLQHYYTTDPTMESLGIALTTSPGIVYARDELVSWVKSMDAYRSGRGGDRQKWLSGWSKDPWKIDRKKSEPIFVPDPVVCVVGGIQPDVLGELAHEAGSRDGFVDRILWSYPAEHFPDDTDDLVDPATLEEAYQLFKALRPLTPPGEDPPTLTIHLSQDARSLWRSWRRDNTRLLREATGLALGILAKLSNQTARLALVLHCLAHPDDPERHLVAAETMFGALDLAEYFRISAFRVLPRFDQHGQAGEGSLVGRVAAILDEAGGTWVSRRGIRDALHRNQAGSDIEEALARLEEQGRAERRVNKEAGVGRPPEEWRSLSNAARARNQEREEWVL